MTHSRERMRWDHAKPYKLTKTIDLFEHPFSEWPFTPKLMRYRSAIRVIVPGDSVVVLLSDNGVCGAYLLDGTFLGYANPTSTSIVKCVWYVSSTRVFIITYVLEQEEYRILRAFAINEEMLIAKQFYSVTLLFASIPLTGRSFIEYDSSRASCLVYSETKTHVYRVYKGRGRLFVPAKKIEVPVPFSEAKLSYGVPLFISLIQGAHTGLLVRAAVNEDVQIRIPIEEAKVELLEYVNNMFVIKQANSPLRIYDRDARLQYSSTGTSSHHFRAVTLNMDSVLGIHDETEVRIFDPQNLVNGQTLTALTLAKDNASLDVTPLMPVTDVLCLLVYSESGTTCVPPHKILPQHYRHYVLPFLKSTVMKKRTASKFDVFASVSLYDVASGASAVLAEVNKESTTYIAYKPGSQCLDGLLFIGSDTGVVDIYSS